MTYKKKIALGILATLAVSSIGAAGVFASDGSDDDHNFVDLTALQDALDVNDYDAFVTALDEIDERAADHMTQEIFDKVLENYETREAVNDAIETGEYSDWVAAVSEMPGGETLIEVITEDEWISFQEFHDARESGDHETAKTIAAEIGLDEVREQRMEHRAEKRERNEERREVRLDAKSALEAADYEAWLEAIAGTPAEDVIGSIINENNFDDLVEMHELIQDGEKEAAQAVAEELGLPEAPQHRMGKMFHRMQGLLRGIFAE